MNLVMKDAPAVMIPPTPVQDARLHLSSNRRAASLVKKLLSLMRPLHLVNLAQAIVLNVTTLKLVKSVTTASKSALTILAKSAKVQHSSTH